MLIALNAVLSAILAISVVGLLVHVIRSEHKHLSQGVALKDNETTVSRQFTDHLRASTGTVRVRRGNLDLSNVPAASAAPHELSGTLLSPMVGETRDAGTISAHR